MAVRIETASEVGFCFGVRRAVSILEKVACERGGVETLGAVVHNQQVLQRLAEMGVRVAKGVDDIQGDTVVISAHGVNPQLEEARFSHFITQEKPAQRGCMMRSNSEPRSRLHSALGS